MNEGVSVVITVFNEETNVERLLRSLIDQTKVPDEIVVVDGGSTDNTLSVISNFKFQISNNRRPVVRVLSKPGLSIAQGRNYGVKIASNKLIVMTDAGCVTKRDWVDKITRPIIKNGADIVAGYYTMTSKTPLQRVLAFYLGIPKEKYNEDSFFASTRSIAFKKSLWEKVGGFNESLYKAGEDTLFNYKAVKSGAKYARAKNALVEWEVPKTIGEAFRKFYSYAMGDVQTGIWWDPVKRTHTHNIKILAIFFRYIVFVTLIYLSFYYFLVLALLYILWSFLKAKSVIRDVSTFFLVPTVQVLSDIAVMAGAISALVKQGKR